MKEESIDTQPSWYSDVSWHKFKMAIRHRDRERKRYIRLRILDAYVNDLQRESITKVIDRAKFVDYIDIVMRVNGKEERIEADWLKHLLFD